VLVQRILALIQPHLTALLVCNFVLMVAVLFNAWLIMDVLIHYPYYAPLELVFPILLNANALLLVLIYVWMEVANQIQMIV
jgi:hypothetical protein